MNNNTLRCKKLTTIVSGQNCYISAIMVICFCLMKGRTTYFRPKTVVFSFFHLMVLLFKVLFNHSAFKCCISYVLSVRAFSFLPFDLEIHHVIYFYLLADLNVPRQKRHENFQYFFWNQPFFFFFFFFFLDMEEKHGDLVTRKRDGSGKKVIGKIESCTKRLLFFYSIYT